MQRRQEDRGRGEGEQCVRFNQVCKKKPSRPLTAELKRTRRQVFANSWAQILRFLEVHTICCSVPGGKRGWRPGTDIGQHGVGDSLGCTRRECSPSQNSFGRGYISFPRTRDLTGVIEQPLNSRGHTHTHRSDNLDTAFCCASLQTPGTYRVMQLPFQENQVPGPML